MKITIQTIPHGEQRYETAGDWAFHDERNLVVYVSDVGNEYMEALIGIHEMIEALLCRKMGVPEESVTAFDMEYEKSRKEGDESEPGDDPKAPYRFAHQAANRVERVAARVLDVPWDLYERKIERLFQKEEKCESAN